MPEVSEFKPGSFCWTELATIDQAAAKDFYSKLFGWTINDQPMGPGQVYTMFELKGKSVSAAYGMDPEQLKRGVPPHWNLYIAVANVDEATKSAENHGA